jgi:hypothetical protein
MGSRDASRVSKDTLLPRDTAMCPWCQGPFMPLLPRVRFEGTAPGRAGSLVGCNAADLRICFHCNHLWALQGASVVIPGRGSE